MKNAFNEVSRHYILEEVANRCPIIFRWVNYIYGSPSNLFWNNNTILSAEGVIQGDGLSVILFCLAYQPVLKMIHNNTSTTILASYVDDTSAITSIEDMKKDNRNISI